MEPDPRLKDSRTALTLAALGVVYGDIGTSPLYAAKETFNPDHGIPLDAANVLGGLSTIFWSLMIVVSLKYVILIMRADNRGEGGIMALLALASSAVKDRPRWRVPVVLLGVSARRCSMATRCSRRRSRCSRPSRDSRSARPHSSPTSCRLPSVS